VKVTPDTNVLVRLIAGDDPAQQIKAIEMLEAAESVAVSVHALCELAWVLDRVYGFDHADVSTAIRRILDMHNVAADRPTVEAGLTILDAGGDFADGVIAFDGRWLGGETFVSFDKKAVKLHKKQGTAALLLS
jgi:predicted nucleic-acid-binding protein